MCTSTFSLCRSYSKGDCNIGLGENRRTEDLGRSIGGQEQQILVRRTGANRSGGHCGEEKAHSEQKMRKDS